MKAPLLVLLVAAYVNTETFNVENSSIVARIKTRMIGNRTNKAQKLLKRIKEDFNMSKLEDELSECEETLEKEPDLSPEQKQFLERLALTNDKIRRRDKSVEDVNKKCGIIDALYQGDMLLSKEQRNELIADAGNSRSKRQAYNDTSYPGRRWPKGVYYSLDGTLNETAKTAFRKAVELWMNNTCIDFFEDYEEEADDLLLVFSEYGCWAEVGRQEGWQLLSLGKGCETIGMATHEIGHALGFWHTHSRHDRNKFITVLKDNIKDEQRKQFVRRPRKVNNNYNITYDYGSVMHYAAKSFIKNASFYEGNFTILPKDLNYTETLGSKFIAFYDLLMMNTYYNCTDRCKGEPNATQKCNYGFPHPRDCSKCICPSGYGGEFCNERPTGCGAELNATGDWQWLNDSLKDAKVGRDGLQKCNYWIKAPKDRRVEITIVETPEHYNDGCTYAGVEIKTRSDQRLTGYRFCSNTVNTTLISESSLVPVITYARGNEEDEEEPDEEDDEENEGNGNGDGSNVSGDEDNGVGEDTVEEDEDSEGSVEDSDDEDGGEHDDEDDDEDDDDDEEDEDYGEEYFGITTKLLYRYV